MHELAISQAMLDAALAHSGGARVVRVQASIGALRQASPSTLAFYFEIAARGTPCEGAELETRLAPVRMSCPCGHRWELEDPVFLCPACGGGSADVLDGDQLTLDSIEILQERCTALP